MFLLKTRVQGAKARLRPHAQFVEDLFLCSNGFSSNEHLAYEFGLRAYLEHWLALRGGPLTLLLRKLLLGTPAGIER